MNMDDVATVTAWAVEHAAEIAVALLAISGAFSQLAAITPWTWDDRAAGFFGGVVRFAKVLAGNYGHAKNDQP
jgi:hypothetical protein